MVRNAASEVRGKIRPSQSLLNRSEPMARVTALVSLEESPPAAPYDSTRYIPEYWEELGGIG